MVSGRYRGLRKIPVIARPANKDISCSSNRKRAIRFIRNSNDSECCRKSAATQLVLELSCSLGAPMVRSRYGRAVFTKERPMMRRTYDLRQAPDSELLILKKRNR